MTLEKAISTLKRHQSVMGEGYPLREAITVVLEQLKESEDLKKVVEKHTVPKKLLISPSIGIPDYLYNGKCPTCKKHLGWWGNKIDLENVTFYCHVCGQLLQGVEEVEE